MLLLDSIRECGVGFESFYLSIEKGWNSLLELLIVGFDIFFEHIGAIFI